MLIQEGLTVAEPKNETQLTARIVRAIERNYPDAWVLKVHGGGYQRVGVPDLLVCVMGKLIGIEVKHRKPGESFDHMRSRVTDVQWREIEKIRAAGGAANVADSEEAALAIIRGAIDPWV